MLSGAVERPSNLDGTTGGRDQSGINETIQNMILDNEAYLLCVEEGRTDCQGGFEKGNRIASNPFADDFDKDKDVSGDQSTGRLPVEDPHDNNNSGFNGDIDALDINEIDYLLCLEEGRTDCDQRAPPTGGSPDKPYPNRCADGSFGCLSGDDDGDAHEKDSDNAPLIQNNIFTQIFGGASNGLSTASLASACSLILIAQSFIF